MFNQGLALYEAKILNKRDYCLKVIVHDFALVYLGKALIEVFDRTKKTENSLEITVDMQEEHGNVLKVLVEASGHINFDTNMKTDQKGLYRMEGYEKGEFAWKTWKLPLDFEKVSAMQGK